MLKICGIKIGVNRFIINTFALIMPFSAIRQYDEDWNLKMSIIHASPLDSFQPFASMMRIETTHWLDQAPKVLQLFSHSPVWWGLKQQVPRQQGEAKKFFSAIRQYDEDWNIQM